VLREEFPAERAYASHPDDPAIWFARCPVCRSPILTLTITEVFEDGVIEFNCSRGCHEGLIGLLIRRELRLFPAAYRGRMRKAA
jgi:hypothetical protein